MTLELDTRQRAMLQEMGITVWQPEKLVEVEVNADEVIHFVVEKSQNNPQNQPQNTTNNIAPQAINTSATAQKQPKNVIIAKNVAKTEQTAVVLQPMREGLQEMDWESLEQTVQTCQACQLCTGRKQAVFGQQAQAKTTDWLIVGDPPSEADEASGTPFSGDEGVLLGNMLKAMGLSIEQVTLTSAVKCRTEGQSTGAQELAQCEAYLRRQVAITQPKMILAMGRYAAQALLANTVSNPVPPLGQLRGKVHHYQGIPVVVTYSPSFLLRKAEEKAKAWADLCLAMAALN